MNASLTSLTLLIASFLAPGINSNFDLPKTWTKDFKIEGYEDGGLKKNEGTYFTYTFDSITYTERTGAVKNKTGFSVTESQRAEILKKLEEYKVGDIPSKKPSKLELDAEGSRICFLIGEDHCLTEEGLDPNDRGNYFAAYAFLLQYAKQKGDIKN